jgi:hypothetical protein
MRIHPPVPATPPCKQIAFSAPRSCAQPCATAVVLFCLSALCLSAAVAPDPLQPYRGPSIRGVDTSTLTGKVMTGYQGWFNCEGDGAGLGWTHWARNKSKPFAPGNVTVDLWPDTSELPAGELFTTGFKFAEGQPAEVFSSFNPETVRRHFRWMREYGIDGAFVQRFANGVKNEATRHHKDVVLANCREGANREGRAYAVMYDLSGLPAGGVTRVTEDWKRLRTQMHIGEDPDEVDEGTAIFKCTNKPPGGAASFLTYEGLPSDHYLWLTGEGARLLRGERLGTGDVPIRNQKSP